MLSQSVNDLIARHVMGWKSSPVRMTSNFAGDISEAWRVVDKMHVLGWRVTLMSGYDFKWNAQFSTDAKMGLAVEATAPEAICRAALRALEVPGA